MGRIERLLIVAGPTAAGKSTFLKKLIAGDSALLLESLAIEDIRQWKSIGANREMGSWDFDEDRLILHYEFLWGPGHSDRPIPIATRLPVLLEAAREVSALTLWTPPERLERQLLDGKLRVALPPVPEQKIKAMIFRSLPLGAVRRLAAVAPLRMLNERLPTKPLLHYLLLLGTYSRPELVVALYRRWFDLCEKEAGIEKTVIVECDDAITFYSRDEWERRVKTYEEAKSR
jgi:hypothetical protein